MSQSAKSKGKQREPPPTLFLHPSPAASHVSLPGILAPGAPVPAATVAGQPPASLQRSGSLHAGSVVSPVVAGTGTRPARNLRTADSYRSATDRTDALWAEMQATLEEVELSASGGTHVFGPDHDAKLAGLRAAQIALAQAWARSEADDAIETSRENATTTSAAALAAAGEEVRSLKATVLGEASAKAAGGGTAGGTTGGAGAAGGSGAGGDAVDASKGGATAAGGSGARPGSSGGAGTGTERLGAKLEEETEVDILLARKRREANDQYFQRVNQGVLDVVAKLEEVAVAMRAVEQESKDIWGETESVPGSAKT